MTTALDVIAIGNALVDVLAHAQDSFLEQNRISKGSMSLIDATRAEALYETMGPAVEISGGSAANSIAGLASLGGKGAFIGKVSADQLGSIFAHDIRSLGVEFTTRPHRDGAPTGRCLIFVTPDAQRTMQTFLGSAAQVGPDDVDPEQVKRAQVTYLEGYLFDPPEAKRAFVKAAEIAHDAHRKVALTLSDRFCVDRHRAEFQELVHGHIDILFANESEITALYQAGSFDTAVQAVRGKCDLVVLTRSEKGAVVVTPTETVTVPAEPITRLVDTTGAGDQFAAGFLFGYTRGRNPRDCARLGAIAAAEVIQHFGARPEVSLASLIQGRV
ncbi:MAG: adenosine kinase [Planctomycetes bacterium]|nr:adenosine kinase [Planctomycetota bacterium]